ncbi:Lrp/AsnC family transcriptional regulator, partial [Pseudomonas aeruginosa]|nr:Lrp/AsnC family transcriptional regulator [Pseudomonas aeruginosa]
QYGASKTSLILSTPFERRIPAELQVHGGKVEALRKV